MADPILTTTPTVENRAVDAVVGIDLDYETVGQGSMLMVSASGTAVRLAART